MHIIEHSSKYGVVDTGDYFAIPELDRESPAVPQFIKLANLSISLDKPTAFLYIDGVSFSPSDAGLLNAPESPKHPVMKVTSSCAAHSWVRTFKNPENLVKVDTISSTCAAGIQALYEANRLLEEGTAKEVIIIGCERISEPTIRMFKELSIPITCGDGFVYMKVSKGDGVSDIKWKYGYNSNPFKFTQEQLDTLIPDYPVDYVKLHGTGTKSNTEAESGLACIGKPIVYKPTIGHTQGLSSLLEACMVLDDYSVKGKVLVTANGMGGYYGAFTMVLR